MMSGADTLAVAGWRSLLAVPLLTAVCGPRLMRIRWDAWLGGVAALYAATLILFVAANKMVGPANAILLQYMAPVWIALAGFVVPGAERPAGRDLVVAGVCLAAMTLFFADRLNPEGVAGNLTAVASGMCFAGMTLLMRRGVAAGRGGESMPAVLAGNLLVAAVGAGSMASSATGLSARDWAVLAGLGTLQLALPYMLFGEGIRRMPAARATVLAMAEPVLNPVWVALFDGAVPGPGAIAGGVLLLATLAADALIPRKPEPAEPPAA
jgi:drug/metabolite transporter (DMT)-like permease